MKTVSISEIGKIVTGSTPPTSNAEYWGNKYLFVKPTDIVKGKRTTCKTETMLSKAGREKCKNIIVPQGATCVVCIGSIGEKLTYAHTNLVTNQQINSIIPYEEYDSEYVYYLIKNNMHKVKAANQGSSSGRENVSKSNFGKITVEVEPDIECQKKIASVLVTYDLLIENIEKQLVLLEESTNRIYKEWFINMHFPQYEDIRFDNGIPIGWKEGVLGDIALFKRGKTITKAQVKEGNVPVVAGGLEPAYYHSEANTTAPVITVSGSGANAGFARLYNVDVFASDCSFLDSEATQYIYYIYCFVKDNKATLDALQKGSAQPHVYAKDINSLKTIIPSDDILKRFCLLVSPYFDKIKYLQRQVELLVEARDRLLPKLMNGEIEV